jgi:hypothetical protein
MASCITTDSLPATSSFSTRILGAARWSLLVLLIAIYPLAKRLPERMGWENGWIEEAQIAILLIGFLYAAWTWSGLRRTTAPAAESGWTTVLRLSLIAMPFWLMCAGRETSWGATFLTRGVMETDGPYFSSSKLWYHMAIKPLVLLAMAVAVLAFLRWRLDRPLLALVRRHRFPWFEVFLVLGAALMATLSESSMFFDSADTEILRMMIEELTETVCYLGLFLMQARLFGELRHPPACADAG